MNRNVIILLVAIFIVLAIFTYNFYSYRAQKLEITQINRVYESFLDKQVLGTDVMSVINKAVSSNEKNQVQKNEKGKYIDNGTNSIQIEVKFQELDKVVSMEAISGQGYNEFVYNFGAASFKCTKIEYHTGTGSIRYMYFEQI